MNFENLIAKNMLQLESNFVSCPRDDSVRDILYSRSGQLHRVVDNLELNKKGQQYLDYVRSLNTGSSERFYYSVFNLTTPGCYEGCDFCFEEITRRREKWDIESIPFLVALHHVLNVVEAIQASDDPDQPLVICNNSNPRDFIDEEFLNREGQPSDVSDFLFEVGSAKLRQKIRIQINASNRRKKRDLKLNEKIATVCQQLDSGNIKIRLSAHFRNNFYRKLIKKKDWQALEEEYTANVVEAVRSLRPLRPDIGIRLSSWQEFDIYMESLPRICQQLNELGCQYNLDHKDPAITVREDYSNPIQDEYRLFPTDFKRSREITSSSVRCRQGTFVSNDYFDINADKIDFETGEKIENDIREALLNIKNRYQVST
jgi:hypothetical protein